MRGLKARVVVALALAALLVTSFSSAATAWTKQSPLPTGFGFEDVDMVSATEAWAVGGVGTSSIPSTGA